MSTLAEMKSDVKVEDETDTLGGAGPLDSGAYPTKVSMAYLKNADSGAVGVVLTLKTDDNREIRTTEWIQSGDAKGNKNYFEHPKTGEKKYLPGFNTINALCLLTTGVDLYDVNTAMKTVNIYDYELKKEVPTEVEVLTDLLGKDIIAGVILQTVDKTAKNDKGEYVPTGKTRNENELSKFFRSTDRLTTAEIRAETTESAFYDTWVAKWTGVTRDRSKGGSPAGAAASGSSPAPTKSLFK